MIRLAAAILLLLASAPVRAAEGDGVFRFDPSACDLDAGGRLFVRFPMGYQFAFPMDVVGDVHTGAEDVSGLPRNTAEPEGCPDNPMTMLFLHLRWVPGVGAPDGEAPAPRWSNPPDAIEDFAPLSLRLHGNLEGQGGPRKDQELWHKRYSERPGRVQKQTSGLLAFWGPPGEGMLPGDGYNTFIAQPDAYPLQHGLPFAARCNGAFRPGGRQLCWASYAMAEGLSLVYRFRTDAVPIEDLLRFDRHIQGYVAAHQLTEAECTALGHCRPRWHPEVLQ